MRKRRGLFTYGVTIPLAIVLAFPFFWMAVTSLKPEAQVYDPTKVWSFHPTLASYGFLFHHTDYLRWLRNSCFVGLMVVVITLAVAMPAGYALQWSGQYESMERVRERLRLIVPATLFIILVLLYMNTR